MNKMHPLILSLDKLWRLQNPENDLSGNEKFRGFSHAPNSLTSKKCLPSVPLETKPQLNESPLKLTVSTFTGSEKFRGFSHYRIYLIWLLLLLTSSSAKVIAQEGAAPLRAPIPPAAADQSQTVSSPPETPTPPIRLSEPPTASYESSSTEQVLSANPIQLRIVKNAPSSERPQLGGELSLSEAVQNGIKNNLTLKQSQETWLASKFLARAALARFGPSASFNTIFSTSSLNQMMFFPGDTQVASTPMQPIVKGTSFSSLFAATQPVFTGGKLIGNYKAARAQERQSLASLAEDKLSTALKVKDAYWNAAWSEAKLRVAADYVKYRKWTSSNVKARMNEGKAPRADYLREEAELARAQTDQNRAYRDYNTALLNLKVAMAVNLGSEFKLKDGLEFKEVAGELSTYLLEAAKNRPELARAASKVAEAKARRTVAMSKYSPQVNLYGLGSSITGSNPDNNPNGRWGGVFGIVGGVTLFDSGERLNQLRAANAAVRQAEIARQDAELKVAQEVSQAWIDLDLARRNMDLAKDELKSAEEDNRLYSMRYQVGKAIALEQFDATVKMFQSRLAVLEAIYQYKLAESKLNFSAGKI